MTLREQFIEKLKARTYSKDANYHRSCYIPDKNSSNGATAIQVDVLNKFVSYLTKDGGWKRERFEAMLILKEEEFDKIFGATT